MTEFVPADHTGLWRREVITAPGYRDETTRVLWLQTRAWYADVRVPADRPPPRGEGFGAYNDAELIALAGIQGFAGQLTAKDGICFWRRDLDHQPAGPLPDEARCGVEGEVMIEDGLHADYQEIWRREPDSQAPLSAFRLDGADRDGLLVIGGRHLIEFVGRPGPVPVGDSLAALVEAELAAGRRAAAEALLDTGVRYAVRDGEGAWVTRLSSQPWREGRRLSVGFDTRTGQLETDGGVWRLIDSAESLEALGAHLDARAKIEGSAA
jgi:hypothetical protein